MRISIVFFMLLCFFSVTAFSSEATFFLKNGDRITGTLKNFEENHLIIENPSLGEAKILWETVAGIQSANIFYFRLEKGNIVSAKPEGVIDGKQILVSSLSGRFEILREQIIMVGLTEDSVNPEYLRTQKELKETQEKLERATKIHYLWSGFLQASFSGTSGNTDSATFVGIAHVERKTEADKFTAHLEGRYGKSDNEVSAEEVFGYLRENVEITSRLYVYGRIESKWDRVKDIDIAMIAELGFGIHIIKEGEFQVFKDDKITLDFDLGATYSATDYSEGEDTNSAGMVARLIYDHVFANKWHINMSGQYIQDFEKPQNKENASQLDGYKLKFEFLLEIPLTDVLAFTCNLKDEYVNAPAPGNKRNDFYWLFGLKINL